MFPQSIAAILAGMTLCAGLDVAAPSCFHVESIDDMTTVARLRLVLADGDAKARLEAVSELAVLDTARAAEALAAAALSNESSAVREEAVYELGEAGDENAFAILEQALEDPDPGVREAVVEAFADRGGDDSAWALATALHDEDASLREQAVLALGEIGGEIAVVLVQRALGDELSSVREAAREVLDELGEPQVR